MNESHRQKLMVACAFATEFIKAADREARGASPVPREQATMQLRAALGNLESYNPDIHKSTAQLMKETAAIRHIREDFEKEAESWR